jgi:antirestriction protein ArdC
MNLRVRGVKKSGNAMLRVLIHELAHASGVSSKNDALDLTYAEAEVAVECVSYIVAATAGLDTSSEAVPYMAGWAGEEAKVKVRALAALIDATAKELEQPILALLQPEGKG